MAEIEIGQELAANASSTFSSATYMIAHQTKLKTQGMMSHFMAVDPMPNHW